MEMPLFAMTRLDHLQIRDLPPDDEICHCTQKTSALLRYAMSEFPLFCASCSNQLFPAAFSLPEELAGKIVDWRTVYAALYDLWLDSRSYEEFALSALCDPSGEVNRVGMSLATELSQQRLTYFWWFRRELEIQAESCPLCSGSLDPHPTRDFAYCHPCRIAI
jgi:hypothetical protein